MKSVLLGPSGGIGGREFSEYTLPPGARLKKIHIFVSNYIDAVQFIYVDGEGNTVTMPRIGGLGGELQVVALDEDEYVTGISGMSDWYIDQIQFHTNKRSWDMVGGIGAVHSFHYQVPNGYEVVGLFGRADWYIDAIGVIAHERSGATTAAPAPAAEPPMVTDTVEQQPASINEPAEPQPAQATVPADPIPTSIVDAAPTNEKREPRPKDLQKVDGIGPKVATILIESDILDLNDLSAVSVEHLRSILEAAGARYKQLDPALLIEQAALGAKGDWEGLKELQKSRRG
ncbi:MAG: hypothetical protein HC876_04160 [Chloroflexaceae bacterium]|nr:hypothetical protein [Chloroflexaceae bacterium]NJO04776.1 hypothetical protein [Chloroflexaceae bacterium]